MLPHRWRHGVAAAAIDWPQWLRNTERQRKLLARADGAAAGAPGFWAQYFLDATDTSFRLDGLILPAADLSAAVARGSAAKRTPRSRQQQRARNHVAILHYVERLLSRGVALKTNAVVRWYTSIACGLSIERLDEPTMSRLDGIVRQINSPHLRLAPAVQGIARLHRQTLADPAVPSFNGILARLLLRYHLGRCGLPPVVFVPEHDAQVLADELRLLPRMLERIEQTYCVMLNAPARSAVHSR